MLQKYAAVVIGTSAGGLYVLTLILEKLPADYPIPIIIVQHRAKEQRELLEEVLQHRCRIKIKQADEKEKIESRTVYIAPPDYHLLVESDLSFSLSSDEYVRYSKPSIDVLFETAADVWKEKLAGIILTGANDDGAAGIKAIKKYGGLTIAQSLDEAQFGYMPRAAIETGSVVHVWKLDDIIDFLLRLGYDQE